MRQLPRPLQSALGQQAQEPLAIVAVWAERGPEARLITAAQLAGNGDPAAVDDAGVTVTDGALVLAAGVQVAMDAASTAAANDAGRAVWSLSVTEVGQLVWA